VETTVGILLACVLVFVAVFFGMRQRRTLALVRFDDEMSDTDRGYLTRQVRRRLICSALLLVFAGLLVGWLFMRERVVGFVPEPGEPITEEAKDQLRFVIYYWIGALFVLMAILVLASWDFVATARYGFARQKQLEQERRAMMEMEAAKLRHRRQELN
jgi:hypothetical protein